MPVVAVPKRYVVRGGIGLGAAMMVGAGAGLAVAALQGANNVVHDVAGNPILPWAYKVNTDTRKLEKLDRIIQNTQPVAPPAPDDLDRQRAADEYRRMILDMKPQPKAPSPWAPIEKDTAL